MKITEIKRFVYETQHPINQAVSKVLAKGFNARTVPPVVKLDGLSIFYGILRGTGEIMQQCEQDGSPFVYCDHSFFSQTRATVGRGDYSGYFRLIKNGRYSHNTQDHTDDRWLDLDIDIAPWKKDGEHIVVVPLSSYVAKLNGIDPQAWLGQTIHAISQCTDRDIVIKPKDSDAPLSHVLKRAHALVTLDSNAAVDAAVMGVPVFTSTINAAAPIANFNIADIETPNYPDRQQWLNNLAYQQFTLSEILNGYAMNVLYGDEDVV